MNFKTLVAGITWFQGQLVKFIDQAEKSNVVDQTRIEGIQAKITERTTEVNQAKKLNANIAKLFDDDDTNDDILDEPLSRETAE